MWELVEEGTRWRYADPEGWVHLLQRGPDALYELHGQWLHRYEIPDPIPEQPLEDCVWIDTVQFAEPVISTEADGWAYLADRIAQAG